MRGTFCFLIMLAGLPAVKAQIWCPPGAEWIMKPDFNLPMSGNSRVYYAGDTVLGGIPGQRLGAETFFVNWGDTVIQNSEVATGMVTSSTADVVSVWSIDSLTWDTLFWFSALPGDRWQAPHLHIVPGNPTEWIEVQDTATVVIDGMPLRQLNVVQVCEGNWPPDWGGQITEPVSYTHLDVYKRQGSNRSMHQASLTLPIRQLSSQYIGWGRKYGDTRNTRPGIRRMSFDMGVRAMW